MSRILLVEEGRDAASVLLDELHRAGHEVDHIDDGAVALHRILTSPPALTLLDVQLPHVNGLQILEKIRARSDHPIIMLTALAHEADRLRGFELGADDYVCKPFSPREVVVRIHTVLRRYAQRRIVARPSVPITFGAVRGCAILDGHYLPLTRRESLLLRALSQEPGRVLTRSKLLEAAFPEALDVNERVVDTHIKNLRKKLATVSTEHDWIRSVYGVGFAWESQARQDA
ncbi:MULTISPECIES: response regulator [Variovorax]|jgi:two-component system response regulator BaeR|uniref:response regulator n=1 Tax=Variovorax TaxID=34072 RepID=UPI00089B49F9|nr:MULTISPECIES: response regulator [Variovorax]MDQ0084682.1 two-component system response regulator BaeR [Variovorax boronicumulans]SDY62289.1 two-component system, OmpR family, response regulator BaeR [Variovorax sp. YR634]SDZ71091.1 two-component system, OmpR family, response regulator BaeR [Variovorax sp. YR266]SET70684.1 two-component system, OmpR family, response regulator BaeR [Variovorax sp. OV084]